MINKKLGYALTFLITFCFTFLAIMSFAEDDISIDTGIVGNGRFLGGKTIDGSLTVPMIGIDSSGNTVINALSGKSVKIAFGKTAAQTFDSTGADLASQKTTSETVAAAGSTVTDAAALSGTKIVHRVTGADGTVGVKFVTATPVGSIQFILNGTAGVLKVYGEAGSTVNGGSADAAFSALTGIKPIICIKTAALTYLCA